MTPLAPGRTTVVRGTLDPASDRLGYAAVRRRGPSVVAIGKFDGVHRGHRELLSGTRAEAERRGLQAGVVTFDRHPGEVLRGARHRYLSTVEERAELLAEAGIDFVLLLRTSPELLSQAPEDFVGDLSAALDCRTIVVGADFRFGRGATGDVAMLAELAQSRGIQTIAVSLAAGLGDVVSSTRIREELGSGRVDRAAALLGRPFSVPGVLHATAGRQWMVTISPRLMLPAAGSYRGRVELVQDGVTTSSAVVVVAAAADSHLRVVPLREGRPGNLRPGPVRVFFDENAKPHLPD
jgi:FAD synthase